MPASAATAESSRGIARGPSSSAITAPPRPARSGSAGSGSRAMGGKTIASSAVHPGLRSTWAIRASTVVSVLPVKAAGYTPIHTMSVTTAPAPPTRGW